MYSFRKNEEHAGQTLSQIECRCPKCGQMALSYWLPVAENLNSPETSDLGEKVQESVCPFRLLKDKVLPRSVEPTAEDCHPGFAHKRLLSGKQNYWIADTVNYFPLFGAPFAFTISHHDCGVHSA